MLNMICRLEFPRDFFYFIINKDFRKIFFDDSILY
jgi:hypothetical protein